MDTGAKRREALAQMATQAYMAEDSEDESSDILEPTQVCVNVDVGLLFHHRTAIYLVERLCHLIAYLRVL